MDGGMDTITDFNAQHDILRFDDLFGGGQNGQDSLAHMLDSSQSNNILNWDASSNTFTAGSADNSGQISLTFGEAAATLTVSYHDTALGQDCMQQVQLDNFSMPNLASGNEAAEIANMLQQIIKVTG